MKKLKVGIIGFGKVGKIRAAVLSGIPGVAISAIADPVRPLAQESYGAKIYCDYKDLVREDLDCILVATPNHVTPKAVIAAMSNKKHVFCEKPPGRSVKDIKDIIAAQKKIGVKLKFGFNHRFHEVVKEAKSIVDGGRMGKILWMRGIYGKSGGLGFEKSWRSDKNKAGGGILLDQGIHMIDLFRNFAGDFDEVKSVVTNSFWNIDMEDNAFAILRNKHNQVAMLHSSATQWKHTFALEICMEKGYIVISGILSSTRSYGRETLIVARKRDGSDPAFVGQPREETTFFDKDDSWSLEMEEFVVCVKNGTEVKVGTSADALKAMELVEKIYNSDLKWRERLKAGA